ncbi:MAG: fumarylacetoacetate hydrolase family protein [Anaerolineales bacterium]|nr:fumarylacetoacetate hydrolase family protein [Anaerolineales bacterium]
MHDLTASNEPSFISFRAWIELASQVGVPAAIDQTARIVAEGPSEYTWSELQCSPDPVRPHLLAPLDEQEVWACGVTYVRSRDAREEESKQIGIYEKVYEADRPEIFFKATPHRVVGDGDAIAVRSDAGWSVPEPELTVVLTPTLDVVGYTAGNDVSSRDIEGENPLYLPQAKIYVRSCSIGPAITLAPYFESEAVAVIEMTIRREEQVVFHGATDTLRMKRSVTELIEYLGRDNTFPRGVFLMTGTGIVPPDDFNLQNGDLVQIDIDRIGRLTNLVGVASLPR